MAAAPHPYGPARLPHRSPPAPRPFYRGTSHSLDNNPRARLYCSVNPCPETLRASPTGRKEPRHVHHPGSHAVPPPFRLSAAAHRHAAHRRLQHRPRVRHPEADARHGRGRRHRLPAYLHRHQQVAAGQGKRGAHARDHARADHRGGRNYQGRTGGHPAARGTPVPRLHGRGARQLPGRSRPRRRHGKPLRRLPVHARQSHGPGREPGDTGGVAAYRVLAPEPGRPAAAFHGRTDARGTRHGRTVLPDLGGAKPRHTGQGHGGLRAVLRHGHRHYLPGQLDHPSPPAGPHRLRPVAGRRRPGRAGALRRGTQRDGRHGPLAGGAARRLAPDGAAALDQGPDVRDGHRPATGGRPVLLRPAPGRRGRPRGRCALRGPVRARRRRRAPRPGGLAGRHRRRPASQGAHGRQPGRPLRRNAHPGGPHPPGRRDAALLHRPRRHGARLVAGLSAAAGRQIAERAGTGHPGPAAPPRRHPVRGHPAHGRPVAGSAGAQPAYPQPAGADPHPGQRAGGKPRTAAPQRGVLPRRV